MASRPRHSNLYSTLPNANALSTSSPTSNLLRFRSPSGPSPTNLNAVSCASVMMSAEMGMQYLASKAMRRETRVMDMRIVGEMSCVAGRQHVERQEEEERGGPTSFSEL